MLVNKRSGTLTNIVDLILVQIFLVNDRLKRLASFGSRWMSDYQIETVCVLSLFVIDLKTLNFVKVLVLIAVTLYFALLLDSESFGRQDSHHLTFVAVLTI